MTSLIKRAVNFLLSKDNEKTRVKYPLNPEQIESDKVKQLMAREIQTLKAQLGKKAIEEKQRETENKSDLEKQELFDELNTQKIELREKKEGKNPVSLSRFFDILNKNPRLKDELEVVDKDDKVVFGKFHDMMIGEDNIIILTIRNKENPKKGDILLTGRTLDSIIHNPQTLANQVKRKHIVTILDENGRRTPNVENLIVPRVTPIPKRDQTTDDDGDLISYEISEEATTKAIEKFKDYEDEISDLSDKIRALEIALGKSRRRNIDLENAVKVYRNLSQESQSELSTALQSTTQYGLKFGELTRQITLLTEQKASNELILQKSEAMVRELLEKLQDWGTKSDLEIVEQKVKEILEWAKTMVPDKITIQQMPEKEVVSPTPPGQSIPTKR